VEIAEVTAFHSSGDFVLAMKTKCIDYLGAQRDIKHSYKCEISHSAGQSSTLGKKPNMEMMVDIKVYQEYSLKY